MRSAKELMRIIETSKLVEVLKGGASRIRVKGEWLPVCSMSFDYLVDSGQIIRMTSSFEREFWGPK